MPVSRKLISDLRRHLKENADPKRAVKMQAYAKSAMPFHGIQFEPLRGIAKEIFQNYSLTSFKNWQDTVLALWRSAKFREERHCAIELTGHKLYREFQTLDSLPLYEEMIVTGAWWDYVDPIAAQRIGGLLKGFPEPMKKVLKQWSNGDDIWLRRTAILSQLKFKEKTDLKFLYGCMEPSLNSNEFFLQKAIGWALRQYAWCDMNEVIRYVEKNQHRLSKFSIREALKHRDRLLKA